MKLSGFRYQFDVIEGGKWSRASLDANEIKAGVATPRAWPPPPGF